MKDNPEKPQRTLQQNRALHKWCQLLSDKLNELGLEKKVVLKHFNEVWWTPSSIKDDLVKPVMKAMLGYESTTELTTSDIDKVYDQIMHTIGEKFGIHIPFPSQEETEEYLDSLESLNN
jgi:hypothetical protein